MPCMCRMFDAQLPELVDRPHLGDDPTPTHAGRTQRAEGYDPGYPDTIDYPPPLGYSLNGHLFDRDGGYPSEPLTGGYASPLTLTRKSAMVVPGPSEELQHLTHPIIPGTTVHDPTDRVTPQYPALHLARGLQVVDSCTPVTEWQHSYGFMTIEDTQLPALESPRYSYASIDTNDLLEEAKNRVMNTLL